MFQIFFIVFITAAQQPTVVHQQATFVWCTNLTFVHPKCHLLLVSYGAQMLNLCTLNAIYYQCLYSCLLAYTLGVCFLPGP